jgi:ABC-type lipoprotein release transport system permease subunit
MVTLAVVVAIVMAIGFLATFEPVRRGLAVQPTEALRSE